MHVKKSRAQRLASKLEGYLEEYEGDSMWINNHHYSFRIDESRDNLIRLCIVNKKGTVVLKQFLDNFDKIEEGAINFYRSIKKKII